MPRPTASSTLSGVMGARSFWEKLGRSVGHGWQKAKQFGAQISDGLEAKLELEKAEEALEELHARLGRRAADALVGSEGTAFAADSEDLRDLLRAIREGRDLVARLRAERQAASAASGAEPPPEPSGKEP
ncbi:MAG: hypothetical protein ACUVYA_19195 [Planctomycetota bacterium]